VVYSGTSKYSLVLSPLFLKVREPLMKQQVVFKDKDRLPEIFTNLLYLLVLTTFQHEDSKIQQSVKISTFIATIYLNGILISK
jgi:hypothetical protein